MTFEHEPNESLARAIAVDLWKDMTDRRGFRQAMEDVHDFTQGEWFESWVRLIRNHIAKARAGNT